MPRPLRWADGWPGISLLMIQNKKAELRPLIPSRAGAEAAFWNEIANAGRMRGVQQLNLECVRDNAADFQEAAALEPVCGDAAAAIQLLRALGFYECPEDAPQVLRGLAAGQVAWLSDGSISQPAATEEQHPPPATAADSSFGTPPSPRSHGWSSSSHGWSSTSSNSNGLVGTGG